MSDERAFPMQAHADPLYEGRIAGHPGMTLRDYFAAHALQGAMQKHPTDRGSKSIAEYAYWIADAMMEARAALGDKQDG